jgi:CRISPR/Cas system Type II protein with McrA/HNH and RuvC-like nuclease domain
MNKNLKPQIIELREQGLSYNQIVDKLGCSKSTVSFHLGKGQKEKNRKRNARFKKANPLSVKYSQFILETKAGNKVSAMSPSIRSILKSKRDTFSHDAKTGDYNFMFSLDQLTKKIGDNPKCYLTGKEIDLTKSRSYSLDHIIPRSKGGDNSLDNCGLTCREANQAKSDLSLEEFISLCQSVVDNFK